jgi:hypothetical protein
MRSMDAGLDFYGKVMSMCYHRIDGVLGNDDLYLNGWR